MSDYMQFQVTAQAGQEPAIVALVPSGTSPKAALTPERAAALREALLLAFGEPRDGERGRHPAVRLDAMLARWAEETRASAQGHADACAAQLARVAEFAA